MFIHALPGLRELYASGSGSGSGSRSSTLNITALAEQTEYSGIFEFLQRN